MITVDVCDLTQDEMNVIKGGSGFQYKCYLSDMSDLNSSSDGDNTIPWMQPEDTLGACA